MCSTDLVGNNRTKKLTLNFVEELIKYHRIIWGLFAYFCCIVSLTGQNTIENDQLKALGTRSWIRLDWDIDISGDRDGYKVYWSVTAEKPHTPNKKFDAEQKRYYIKDVKPQTKYWIWVDGYNNRGVKKELKTTAKTKTNWVLQQNELKELKTNPSSAAVPDGMVLVWHDEFNDSLLNRNKWSTNYYSSIDALRGDFKKDMLADNLPQPAYILNGETIDLYVSDSLPKRIYDKKNDKKISSIQTYDWRTNENLLDNSRGGYFEVKVKRSSSGNPKGLNTAFWFDAPGPDLHNYLQRGGERNGVEGVRPKGQVFEIDVFEYITAQFVLHGNVDKHGKFIHNLETDIAKGYDHVDNWVTHGISWSPTSIKHYINGELIKTYNDKHNMHSPNHFMNVLLGSYGSGGTVNMEVDYIRFYQWPLKDGNELPNPGFEDGPTLLPWEGTGKVVADKGVKDSHAVLLKPGQMITQYVYLNNDQDYHLSFSAQGNSSIHTKIDNVKLVQGDLSPITEKKFSAGKKYQRQNLNFHTGKEYKDYKKKIRISFKNRGEENIYIDDIHVKQ